MSEVTINVQEILHMQEAYCPAHVAVLHQHLQSDHAL